MEMLDQLLEKYKDIKAKGYYLFGDKGKKKKKKQEKEKEENIDADLFVCTSCFKVIFDCFHHPNKN